jgi:hypothetical protein
MLGAMLLLPALARWLFRGHIEETKIRNATAERAGRPER